MASYFKVSNQFLTHSAMKNIDVLLKELTKNI